MKKTERKDRNFKFETLQLHVGQEAPDPATGARAVPIYASSSYVFDDCAHAAARFDLSNAGNIYGRLTNPTQDIFEQRIAALEGGAAALAVASGAAAIAYTFQNLAKQGDHIVSAKNIYGGSYNLLEHTLPDYGIETTFVDIFNKEEVEGAIRENTKTVFIETLGNPRSEVVDVEAIAKIAHAHKIPLVVDNTFATPFLVQPIAFGADIVVHSATKFIGGHGTALGGVIVDSCGAQPQLSRGQLYESGGSGSLCHEDQSHSIAGYRSHPVTLPCLFIPSGIGNPVPAGRTPCTECAESGRIFAEASAGGGGSSPICQHGSRTAEAV